MSDALSGLPIEDEPSAELDVGWLKSPARSETPKVNRLLKSMAAKMKRPRLKVLKKSARNSSMVVLVMRVFFRMLKSSV